MDAANKLLLVDDARFLAHAPPAYHPERPERLGAARAGVEKGARAAGLELEKVEAREATDTELARVHAPRFIERLSSLRGKSGYIDPDTYFASGSVDAARLAAGGASALVDAMIDGKSTRGIALLRPPGHHARISQAMGFCLLNNVAVAAAHARARGIPRVAIVDWDVHHGNGTQEIFWRDPNVLYVSLHQFPFYPGTGAVEETGEGDGRGYTVNVPLTAGGGDAVYRGAFERVVEPVLREFAPSLVLVSAGFDAAARDPLAEMTLSADAFGWMAERLADVAQSSAEGRIALILEGGYDLVALEAGIGAALRGIAPRANADVETIARDVDDADLVRAAKVAKRAWASVG